MKPKVYIETSIVSYLTAWPSRDLVTAAHQQITREWWEDREQFELYTSQVVLDEAGDGDPEAARLRLQALSGISILKATEEEKTFSRKFIAPGLLPEKAAFDALHIAISAMNGIDYLLTWNCAHIANGVTRQDVEETCRINGYKASLLCTPEELMMTIV